MKLRFVSHPGIFTWAARIAQRGYWCTHVEVVDYDGRLIGAMGDGVWSRPADYDQGKFSREMLLTLKTTPEQDEIFFAFLRNQIGKPYDYLAIVSFFFPWSRGWQEDDSWFCSELVAAGLAECGLISKEHSALEFSRVTLLDLMFMVSPLRMDDV